MGQYLSCKICQCPTLEIFVHTARCTNCGVLFYYPYPLNDNDKILDYVKQWNRDGTLKWYTESSFLNHHNFTNMLRFMMDKSSLERDIDVLDYGGGGGQFALICKSHFPRSTIYITDIANQSLLDEWRVLNNQIWFDDFPTNNRLFDFIFMNDVFEHVSDPISVLKLLSSKLKPNGMIFIDTPKQFWIYPLFKFFSPLLYTKVLKGTVSLMHLQIWTKKSFLLSVNLARLTTFKYLEVSEYTMPPDFYLNNMGIRNPIIRSLGFIFYRFSKYFAKNKILAVLRPM
jgi:2-polyprenyl-3-methyl-5-hydroxy-6-metoxy-1,4-benzoquinol methylase